MKVLILPFDIASKAPLTLDALNKIEGIEAKGYFVNGFDNRRAKSRYAVHLEDVSIRKNPFKWAHVYFTKLKEIKKLIEWADVLHWIWDSAFVGGWDLKYAKYLNKPGLIEWSGSDIRYPERNREINPMAEILYTSEYEFANIEQKRISLARQRKFQKAGFVPLVTPEMDLYVDKELFPKTFSTLHRLNVHDFKPTQYANARPLIVHSPTRRHAKGTQFILQAITDLKSEFDFDFKLLERMPREEVLDTIKKCDIFIDQLLLGSNGMASCEALSMGRPVLCHIMDPVYQNGLPSDCPIVSTNAYTIKENLRRLLESPELREELGAKGRQYALKYLDVDVKAKELVGFYKELILKKNQ